MVWGISNFLPCLPPRCGSPEVSLDPPLFHCLSYLCCPWVASLTLRTFISLCADDFTFPSPAEVSLSSSGPAHPTTIGLLDFLVTKCLSLSHYPLLIWWPDSSPQMVPASGKVVTTIQMLKLEVWSPLLLNNNTNSSTCYS